MEKLTLNASSMALPFLPESIPLEMYVPGGSGFTAPLAIALLEAGVVTEAMLKPGPNAKLIEVLAEPDERELAMRALSAWWDGLRKAHPLEWRWQLCVQELKELPNGARDPGVQEAWFCLDRVGNGLIPRVSLARRVEHLETVIEGFGQTVLAVLYDAMRYLPEALTPYHALNFMHMLHWQWTESDEELGELVKLEGGDLDDYLTRAVFYEGMPEWVTAPRRVRSRAQIVRAARGEYEKNVIAACDSLVNLVNSTNFDLDPYEIGVAETGCDSVDGFIVILWRENDAIGRAIDDGLNHIGECGEYCEMIDAQPVALTAEAVRSYQRRTELMLQVAERTEALLELIGEPI